MDVDFQASKVPNLIGADIFFMFMSTTCICLRIVSRRLSKAGLWYDDYAIIAALPFALTLPVLNLIAVRFGFGKHAVADPPNAANHWYLILFIFGNIYAPAIAIVKFSILLFYARIFPNPRFRIILRVVGAIVLAWWIGSQIVVLIGCQPIPYFWNQQTGHGKCIISLQKFYLGQAIPNIITDMVLLIIPHPIVWRLQLPFPQKAALVAILLLGHFIVAASIWRLVLIVRVMFNNDITWNYADAAIWSAAEPNVAIASACLPMFRPLYRPISAKLSSVSRSVMSLPPKTHIKSQPVLDQTRNFTRLRETHSEYLEREYWERRERGNEFKIINRIGTGLPGGYKGDTENGIPPDAIHVVDEVVLTNAQMSP